MNRSTKSNKQPKNFSKNQILEKAFQYHKEGNIVEAENYYQNFLDQGFRDPRVLSNYGVISQQKGQINKAIKLFEESINLYPNSPDAHSNLAALLKDKGQLEKAEESIRKAIKINPNFADAHYNLGNILRELGKSKEAELSTRTAIKLNPNFQKAYSNLGNILWDQGQLKEAELSARKAININSKYVVPYSTLAAILRDQGKYKEAFENYIKAISLAQNKSHYYNLIAQFLKSVVNPSVLSKDKLRPVLILLLSRDDIHHKYLFRAFDSLYDKKLLRELLISKNNIFNEDCFKNLLKDNLLIEALKKVLFVNSEWEFLLTKAREKACHLIASSNTNLSCLKLDFLIAIAEQCFINEYVYCSSKEEEEIINNIISLSSKCDLSETHITLLACYKPLYKLLDQIPYLMAVTSDNNNFNKLLKLQIIEPIDEINLSKSLKKLGNINNHISKKVQSQYEDNPYPRWRHGNPLKKFKASAIQIINAEIKPNSLYFSPKPNKLKVLIAGCGTGNQILGAQRYKNALITAIDLSSSSLSYAQRKMNELQINNVELIHMDILEVSLIGAQFDIIECSGVLHHMDNPQEGIESLLSVLKSNGYIKLGLYSELARKDIIKAREYIYNNNLNSSENSIKMFRKNINTGQMPELNSLTLASDFYTLSSCRDLCFHSQEHRFTISKLREALSINNLNFYGFFLPQEIKSLYKKYFPYDKKQTNLKNWEKFEEKKPNTFRSMYQFWAGKN